MKKEYVKPTFETVTLRVEERLASCTWHATGPSLGSDDPDCDFIYQAPS